MVQKNFLTQESFEKKNAELEYLKTTGRDDIAEKIKEARSYGDLSENSEYDEALNEQAKLEARILKLESELKDAEVIAEDADEIHDTVRMGSKVKLYNMNFEEEMNYHILSESEANPDEGIISDQSPVGKGLIGHRVDDVVSIELPNGMELQLKILEISK